MHPLAVIVAVVVAAMFGVVTNVVIHVVVDSEIRVALVLVRGLHMHMGKQAP